MTFTEVTNILAQWAKVELADASLSGRDTQARNFAAVIELIAMVRSQQTLIDSLNAELVRLDALVKYE